MLGNELYVKIVDPYTDVDLVKSISSLLTESTGDFRESRGGHVPDEVVNNVIHKLYTSTESVTETFSKTGFRFALVHRKTDELVSTMLVAKSHDTIFIKDRKSLNSNTSEVCTIAPPNYHCAINFATKKEYRRYGFGKILLHSILFEFREYFSGRGIWIRVEPPFHDIFRRLGFSHVTKYDQFFEAGVSLPMGDRSAWEFNKKYLCNCFREKIQMELMRKYKYKYGTFTIDFSNND